MNATFTTDIAGRVTIAYDCAYTGERITRTFTCPHDGGYVRERLDSGEWTQVCDRLSSRGSTLAAASRDSLPSLIRAEYRAMRRAERVGMR